MIRGSMDRINLSTSSFERVITQGNLYVDKTMLIEKFMNTENTVQLIARQRRLGKSLNMDTLRCFLTDKEDLRHLFKGLHIESSPIWDKAHSAPVFYFDFKQLQPETYKKDIYFMVCNYIDSYCTEDKLSRGAKNYLNSEDYDNAKGLLYLTESVYRATGKRSYILIDEYDKMLVDNYDSDRYEEIRSFETVLLSSALKGNNYLEKALLTGVMRISHESMLSGLNNVVTYDVFNDGVYTECYGLTEDEMKELHEQSDFDIDETRNWYNGVRVEGHAIYNIYSVMSFLSRGAYECFWGKSGTLDMIAGQLNERRRQVLTRLLNREHVEVPITSRISLKRLSSVSSDEAFYSLLVQAGYLALVEMVKNKPNTALVSVPNIELSIVWREFILESLYDGEEQIRTLFDRASDLSEFAREIEYFLCDRLSYHDLAIYKDEGRNRTHERVYHVFLLGILSAYEDVRFKYALSNRESGDGRYDVLVERADANYIFEVKSCDTEDNLDAQATKALEQIQIKRYGVDSNKRLIKIGVAVLGKVCKVKCG